MDNASWHKKAKRLIKENENNEYSDINDKVVFVYLPPYSPDLNPIEQVWKITRRENTHNVFFDSIDSLKSVVDNAFAQWHTPNDQLRTLCS